MDSDSRKAQRNSFAHHSAERLVMTRGSFADDVVEWLAKAEGVGPADRELFFSWRLPSAAQRAAFSA